MAHRLQHSIFIISILTIAFTAVIAYSMQDNSNSELVAMTFNVLCSVCGLGEYDPWSDRIDYFADIFERYDADLIGLQELITGYEVQQVLELTSGYQAIYFKDPDNPWKKDLPDSVILYRPQRFELIEYGFYWLSPTPDVPWSWGWNDWQLWRLVAWTHLRQKSDSRELYFACTHFDPNSPNQEHSAPIVIERTEPFASHLPVIVLGDFNSKPDSEAYQALTNGIEGIDFDLNDSFDQAEVRIIDTYQRPLPDYDISSRIDHIFIGGAARWQVRTWIVDMHKYGSQGRYPSDHFPIIAELTAHDWHTPTPLPTATATPTPAAPPCIWAAGYMTSSLSTTSPGSLHILSLAAQNQADPVESVEIYYLGLPTGVYLEPDPLEEGVFSLIQGDIPPLPGSDRYLLSLIPFSQGGIEGYPWPWLKVGD